MTVSINNLNSFSNHFFLARNREIQGLLEKTCSFIGKKDAEWVKSTLSKVDGYDKASKSLTFFIPFVERNPSLLINQMIEEESLSSTEKEIMSSVLFQDILKDNLFSGEKLADDWFFHIN
jgi:hypothetical protein